ncbi:hypothetical protein M8542_38300 [Amycolatopsis sp. OK19-0408]|uniref:Uncharacterized protein n=1 Tax=Amycolatopsis iheyensis TaxID=2945988 RepID=A0A9X2NJ04_9PSEU|nr:hypothetical protein [Amycolatopsis iheyensis]MCR6488697.1 hypothetical protein [Amycolatopsis iheyensis]
MAARRVLEQARHDLVGVPRLVRPRLDGGASFRETSRAYARLVKAKRQVRPSHPAAPVLASAVAHFERWRGLSGAVDEAKLFAAHAELRMRLCWLERDLSHVMGWRPLADEPPKLSEGEELALWYRTQGPAL